MALGLAVGGEGGGEGLVGLLAGAFGEEEIDDVFVAGLGPIGEAGGEELLEEGFGFFGLAVGDGKLGAGEEGLEVGAGGCGFGGGFFEEAGGLGGEVGEGGVDVFLFEDAEHFAEGGGGVFSGVEGGEFVGEVVHAGEALLVGGVGGIGEFLAFFPVALDGVGFGEVAGEGFFGGGGEVLAEAGFVEGFGLGFLGEVGELGAGGLPGEVGADAEEEDEGGEEEEVAGGAGLVFGEGFLPVFEVFAELLGVVAEF